MDEGDGRCGDAAEEKEPWMRSIDDVQVGRLAIRKIRYTFEGGTLDLNNYDELE